MILCVYVCVCSARENMRVDLYFFCNQCRYNCPFNCRVSAIVGGWATWNRLRGNDDDDWVDRLSHIYTVVLLCIFALFTGGSQYAGDPIQCWCPAHFTGAFVSYTKSYCWIKNTYYIPMHDQIAPNNRSHFDKELTYYQWIPLILLFMAFLFKLPSFVWRMLHGMAGLNINKIVDMTASTQVGGTLSSLLRVANRSARGRASRSGCSLHARFPYLSCCVPFIPHSFIPHSFVSTGAWSYEFKVILVPG